ncbi:hypothetical protein CMQ_8012 [Grosmannia clavigera kw1407]|uniref:Uncharacterized protein n=1 Tax=Grosmannia clavigera (strain kw1407 / UAMH 11150) TaxID=655863 RepID=F0XS00_GROCL|nr:uncharacterized protein CMQ_8012 [Grosmannia clavigera kw1407]EFW99644.1 hypothetical protein CMQ_8012 [Grosmannia clavigera kw1407]
MPISGLDRLERLFSRKKHAASRPSAGADRTKGNAHVLVSPAYAAPAACIGRGFPRPSFICPKAIRMIPRDDSGPNSRPSTAGRGQARPNTALSTVSEQDGDFNPYGRFRSVDAAFAPSASSITIAVSRDGSICASNSCPPTPQRSASLRERRKVSIATLRGMQPMLSRLSAATTTSSDEISPTTTLRSTSPVLYRAQLPPQMKLQLGEFQDLQSYSFQSTADTPPPSDRDEIAYMDRRPVSPSTVIYHLPTVQSSVSTIAGQPTPVSSPKMPATSISTPTATWQEDEDYMERPLLQRDSVCSVVLEQASSGADVEPSLTWPPVARRISQMAHRPDSLRINRQLPVERAPLSAGSVLKEPNLGEFLSLSDEDIAESESAIQTVASAAKEAKTANKEPATPLQSRHKPTQSALATSEPQRPPASVSPPLILRSRRFFREAPPSKPPSFQAPPLPLPLPIPTMVLGERAASPKSPSGAQTPACQLRMSTAVEIARIASHYKFDLAYIATIWPKNMAILDGAMASTADGQTPFPMSPPSSVSSSGLAKRMARSNSRASRMSNHSSCSSVRTTGSNDTVRSSATESVGPGSPAPMGPQSGLEAQLLAAYGLATVKAPYSLSAPTHARMLNTKRWLRFNESNARVSEFSMGYGCAFYQGHVPVVANSKRRHEQLERRGAYYRRPSAEDCDADTEQDDREDSDGDSGSATPRPTRMAHSSSSKPNNRGIVFVAYRRKGTGEDMAAGSGGPENEDDNLDALYGDVEKLVGRILDFHTMQQRQKQLDMLRAVPGLADDFLAAALGVEKRCGPSPTERLAADVAVQA